DQKVAKAVGLLVRAGFQAFEDLIRILGRPWADLGAMIGEFFHFANCLRAGVLLRRERFQAFLDDGASGGVYEKERKFQGASLLHDLLSAAQAGSVVAVPNGDEQVAGFEHLQAGVVVAIGSGLGTSG